MERLIKDEAYSPFFIAAGWFERLAQQSADKRLSRALANECDPIPCPSCGWYQSHMFPRIRKLYHRWMFYVGIAFLIGSFASIVLYVIWKRSIFPTAPESFAILEMVIFGLASCGLLFIVVRWGMARSYDANAIDVPVRLEHAKQHAVAKAVYDSAGLESLYQLKL
jgi:hypothetical protein